ncbi:MAG: hypothetical protein KBF12_13230 [Sebaldella sp.]|nr:hypothetical protein [Sebaldella sp.]
MEIDELELLYFFEEEVKKIENGKIWLLKKKMDYILFELKLDVFKKKVEIKLFFDGCNELIFKKNKSEKIKVINGKEEKIRIFFEKENESEFLEIKKNPFRLDYHSFQ